MLELSDSHRSESGATGTTCDRSDEDLTLPINLFLSQLVRFGHQPVNFQIGVRYYADSPPDGPEWGLRFVVVFLFPK